MKSKRPILLILALIVAYAGFVWLYEEVSTRRAFEATERYAQFLGPPLWNIDAAAGRECANLITSSGGYASVTVFHLDGELFVSSGPVGGTVAKLERRFSKLGLIRLEPFTATVNYHGEEIGRIEAVWVNRNIFIYLYSAIVFLLLILLIVATNFFRTASRQRERAEEALTESRERLRTVVAGAPIILFALNQEGIFTLSEGKGLGKISHEHGELVGASVFDLYDDPKAIREDLERCLKGETFKATRTIDGVSFETWYSPLSGSNGTVERVIGVATDVTELQSAIAKLEARDKSMRQELTLARKIQSAMLPQRMPRVKGLELGMLFIPSGDIGGDFIDFFEYADQRHLGVVFADITGHGVPAALLSAMFKVAMDEVVHQSRRPAECFAQLNQRLAREFPRGNFASAFYTLFDMRHRTMTYAKASQEPALLFRENRELEVLSAGGPVLGILDPSVWDDVRYLDHSVRLREGDLVFFYTDGLVEIENSSGEMLDRQKLTRWITEAFDRTPQELVEQVHLRALEFAGREDLPDDIAVLAVRVTR